MQPRTHPHLLDPGNDAEGVLGHAPGGLAAAELNTGHRAVKGSRSPATVEPEDVPLGG